MSIPVFGIVQLQLQQLMETLNSTEPHYIRCVKPNNLLKPAVFENVNILQQLRCGVSKKSALIYFFEPNKNVSSSFLSSLTIVNSPSRVS